MVHIQWKERYNINHKQVDAQHKRLLDVINQLMNLIESQRPEDEISGIFHRLCTYALDHFSLEEKYLAACGYPALTQQQSEHAYFVERILGFNERYDPSDPELLSETFEFLKTWYLRHILRTDMEYVPWVRRYFREAPLKGILFDFECLTGLHDPRPLLETRAVLGGKSPEDLHQQIFGESSLLTDLEAGAINMATFLEVLSGSCGAAVPEKVLAEAYAGPSAIPDPLQALLLELKTRLKLGLIANANPWQEAQIIRSSRDLACFDAMTLSREAKSRLPNHRIFDNLLEKLGLMSEECLFVTSRKDLAEAAELQLLHGHAFKDPNTLRVRVEKPSPL